VQSTRWDLPTRLLHLGLALAVTTQLGLSLVMAAPDAHHQHPTALEANTFEAHEWVGMAALAIVLAHWLWSAFADKGIGLSHLFPWSLQGRREIASDLWKLWSRQLPEGGARGGLPGLVHGLGLLVVSAMVLTGSVIFFSLPENGGPVPERVQDVVEVHQFIASFVWIYWFGHVGLAIVHHFAGNDTLRAMFRLREPPTPP
jgi:cytochrome b561